KSGWNDSDKLDFLELYLDGKAVGRWFDSWLLQTWFVAVPDRNGKLSRKSLSSVFAHRKATFKHGMNSKGYDRHRAKTWKNLNKVKDFSKALETAYEEKKFNKLCNLQCTTNMPVTKNSTPVDQNLMYEKMILKFDQLSLNVLNIVNCQELQQTKSVAARNRTSDLPDSGRRDEPKGYNVKSIHTHDINTLTKLSNINGTGFNKQDKLRNTGKCFYCKEFGHMSCKCAKAPWNRNKNKADHNRQNTSEKRVKSLDFEEETYPNQSNSYWNETEIEFALEVLKRESPDDFILTTKKDDHKIDYCQNESVRNFSLENIDSFLDLLKTTFDDPNTISNARDLLSRIPKVALYRNGLNEQLKDALANIQQLPEFFDDFVKLSINLDNRQFYCRLEHNRSNKYTKQSTSKHFKQESTPMEVDNVMTYNPGMPLSPLSKEEKEMRIKTENVFIVELKGTLLKNAPNYKKMHTLADNREQCG
ncbi:hypothetical protein BB560_004017, partial [Smittium megazygosporum]